MCKSPPEYGLQHDSTPLTPPPPPYTVCIHLAQGKSVELETMPLNNIFQEKITNALASYFLYALQ
jgi:hypothetical protein